MFEIERGKFMNEIDKILTLPYITAKDLMVIIPKLSYKRALKYIEDFRIEMKDKGYFVPEGRTKVALTKLVKKKFGF